MVQDLIDVKPTYTAKFTFADDTGDLRLTMSWQEREDLDRNTTTFDVVTKKWTRLDRDTSNTTPLLDISLTDLNLGSAWHFDLCAAQAVAKDRLPTQLANFANNLRFNAVAARKQSTDQPFVAFNPYVGLKSLQQRISYRYGIAHSDYTLELTRFQDRTFPARKSLLTQDTPPDLHEARWSVNVYSMMWDTVFANNERLAVGEMVDWKDDIETWFPEDLKPSMSPDEKGGNGFAQLMEKLEKIQKLVKRSEVEMVGGMEIG